MSIKQKLTTAYWLIKDSDYRFWYAAYHGWLGTMNDECFLRRLYRIRVGKELNLDDPKDYTEKLQWLKLYDRRPEYTAMVDKYLAKQYVAEKIGKEYVVPLYGVWNNAKDIDFERLPERFVLKATHNSGGIIICKDKNMLDREAVTERLNAMLKKDYFAGNREWPYKDVKPRIIAEAYLEDSRLAELRDYKFFTFNGEPKVLYIAQGRGKDEPTVADFFDMDFKHLPFTIDHDMAKVPPEKPECFEEMKCFAARLSHGTPQLRVDFYEVDGKVYFGEMTFFHCSGMAQFHPESWNRTFGDWVELPPKQE